MRIDRHTEIQTDTLIAIFCCPAGGRVTIMKQSYEWRCKMQKMGWFGVVRGHSRSWTMPPFDRAHTTS